ncbi:MAG: hypothetical protein ABFD64_02795 [Armatimonadota bacterium]
MSNVNIISGMQFGGEQPVPSICESCGMVRAYHKHDEFTWVREKCQCDYRREEQRQAAQNRARDLQISSLITNGLRELNIPNRYSRTSHSDTRFTPLMAWAESVTNQHKGWFIYGGVGFGKTKLAFDMLRRATEFGALIIGRDRLDISRIQRLGANWLCVPDWVNMQKPGHNDPATAETLDRIQRAYLLLIDDILPKRPDDPKYSDGLPARELRPSAFYVEKVHSLINDRNNRCLPTIITSNYDLAQIGKLFGRPTMSRICEMCEQFELTGRDWRKGE